VQPRCGKCLIPILVENGGVRTLMGSSLVSMIAESVLSGYYAGKAQINALMRALALDSGLHRVGAGALFPGYLSMPRCRGFVSSPPCPELVMNSGRLCVSVRVGDTSKRANGLSLPPLDGPALVNGELIAVDVGRPLSRVSLGVPRYGPEGGIQNLSWLDATRK
jgi:NAD(P)-dependent dehydrogenase (short-subunit alcohol dehydrogenase family)